MRPVVAQAGAGAPSRLKWGWGAALALGLVFALVPGEARAQTNSCGTPDANGALSCADQAWTNGILHTMSNTASALSLTVGGGPATMITAIQNNTGIGLDAALSGAMGDQTLTVGNDGAVVIMPASGATVTTGIALRQRGSGVARGDVSDRVTIGSASNPIATGVSGQARGAGGFSLTSAATIHASTAGLLLWRPAESGTTTPAATTLENRGAIMTSGDGIRVEYATPSAATQSGAITITNSGAITVTGDGQGIRLNSVVSSTGFNPYGNLMLTNRGAITASATDGDGIDVAFAESNTASSGDITIENSAAITANRYGIRVDNHGSGDLTLTNTGDIASASNHAIFARSRQNGAITITSSGDLTAAGASMRGIMAQADGNGDISVTAREGEIGSVDAQGIYVQSDGTGDVTISSGADVTAGSYGIHVHKSGSSATAGDIEITTTGGSITAENFGIVVEDHAGYTGTVTISNGGDIMAERPISVIRSGAGDVSVTTTGGTVRSETVHAIEVGNKTGDASDVTVNVSGGTVRALFNAIQAFNSGTGDVIMTFSGAATSLISEAGTAVSAGVLTTTSSTSNQVKITQGAKILGRTGLYVNARGYSVAETVMARNAQKPDVIDVTWTGSFSHGTTEAEKAMVAQNDNGRFSASFVNTLVFSLETLGGEDATDGVYRGAAGIEADVMARHEIIREVAKGDDPGAFADNAAQMTAVPTGATAADNPYVAQLRAVLGDARFDISTSVFGAIKTGATSLADLTDADIVTYLQTDNANTRTLLRNIRAVGLSDGEKDVLKALAEGADKDALAAALTAAGFTDDTTDDEDYWSKVTALLDRYNVGNIKVAMDGGSIDSRGDGIRAYYATRHENNGAINVTVAEGASITAAKAGIYAANAGMGEGNIRKQTVTVNGMVTGGTAGVYLAGGGRLMIGATGRVGNPNGASSGDGVFANGPSDIENRGTITGGEYGIRVLAPGPMTNAGMSRSSHQVGRGGVVVRNWGRVEGNEVAIEVPAGSTVDNYGTITSTDGILVAFRGTGTSTLTMVGKDAMADGIIEGDDVTVNPNEACREKVSLRVRRVGDTNPQNYRRYTGRKTGAENGCEPMALPKSDPPGPSDPWPLGTSVFALTDDMLSDLTGSIHGAVVDTETALRPGPAAAGSVVWATPFGGARDQNGSGIVADATHYFGGGLVGTSWGAQDVRVGGFIGGSVGRLDVGNSPGGNQTTDVDVQTVFGGLIASRAMGNVLYDARLLIGHMTHDSTRRLSLVETAEVEYASLFFSPEVGVATTLHVTDTLDVLPRLRVRYAGLFTQSFRERGQQTDTRWDMSFDDRAVQVLEWRAEVGVPVAWANGGQLKPRVGLEGRWLLSGHEIKVTDNTNGNPVSYDVGGDDGVITGTVGVGMALPVADSMALVGSFDGALTTEEAWRATGYLGLTYSF